MSVSKNSNQHIIVGQGLAGTCLAWQLWNRQQPFIIIDRGVGGSSRIAAGMVNPITGKNFEPSWRISEFLPQAVEFYVEIEKSISQQIWYPFPVLRLAGTDKEWRKIVSKLHAPDVTPWLIGEVNPPPSWVGAVKLCGGGRLDTRAFLDGSRDFFESQGCFQRGHFNESSRSVIRCDGAVGLMGGAYGPHRCAKGEILTVRATNWCDSEIRIGEGGWLVPQGGGVFKVGSTYEWNELDEVGTDRGRARVIEIAKRLGGEDFEVIAHDASVRPILRRSQPLIGPMETGSWMFNGLGSKGSLYAPGMAARLATWLVEGLAPEPEVDFRKFSEHGMGDE